MAKLLLQAPYNNKNQNHWWQWRSAISNSIRSCSLVDVMVSGSIGGPDYPMPTTTNQSVGYEIFRFDDVYQPSYPVYLKIEYGSGASAGGQQPRIWIQVGTDQNSSGSLQGNVSANIILQSSSSITSGSAPYYFAISGDKNRIAVASWLNHPSASAASYFSVERTKNTDGSDNTFGVVVSAHFGSTAFQQVVPFTGSTGPADNKLSAIVSTVAPSHFAGNLPYCLQVPFYGGALNPVRNNIVINTADWNDYNIYKLTAFATQSDYLHLGTQYTSIEGMATSSRLLMRFE